MIVGVSAGAVWYVFARVSAPSLLSLRFSVAVQELPQNSQLLIVSFQNRLGCSVDSHQLADGCRGRGFLRPSVDMIDHVIRLGS